MKQILITAAITLFISLSCYSQTTYQSGYFINNNDEKIECLIKNENWTNNPTTITVKYSENEKPTKKFIESVKEFGINEEIKYERATVHIDKSSESLDALDTNRNPAFKEEQVFLNVLVEGKASLYSYEGRSFQKFFFKIEDSNIEQLIFKKYLRENNQIAENNYYKQQLLHNLKCPDISTKEIQNLKYRANNLAHLFIKYNKCSNAPFSSYSVDDNKITSKFYLKAGVKNSSLEIKYTESRTGDTDFDNQLGFRIGVEAEFLLPFKNDKWSVLVEPTYQYFVSRKEEGIFTSEVNYHSIEVPLGVRHYMVLDENSRLFINGLLITDFDLDSKFKFKRPNSTLDKTTGLDIKSGINLGLGLGYNYNRKFSAELRYHTDRDVLMNYGDWNSRYSSLSLIFGYSLF